MTKRKARADKRFSTAVVIYDPVTNTKVKKYVYGHTQREQNDKVNNEKQGFVSSETIFGDFTKTWLCNQKSQVASNTLRMYKTAINKFTDINNKPVSDITVADIESIMKPLENKHNQAQKVHMTLDQILSYAYKRRLIKSNPVDFVEKPVVKKKLKRAMTNNELKICELADFNQRERLFMKLIINYGLRKAEALAVTKSTFDFDERVLNIHEALDFSHNQSVRKVPKTDAGYRKIPMSLNDIPYFRKTLEETENNYLFSNCTTKTPISATSYRRMFGQILKKMNYASSRYNLPIPGDFTAHIGRHTFATQCALAGLPIKQTQYLMGHASIAMTIDIYAHCKYKDVDRQKLQEVRDRFKEVHDTAPLSKNESLNSIGANA